MAQKTNKSSDADNALAPKFSVIRLREKCLKLFGVTQSTFDGATYGLNGEYTVEEMKTIIAKWQDKEVK